MAELVRLEPIQEYVGGFPLLDVCDEGDAEADVRRIADRPETADFVETIVALPAFSEDLDRVFAERDAIAALPHARKLRGCLTQPMRFFCQWVADLADALGEPSATAWSDLSERLADDPAGAQRLLDALREGAHGERFEALAERLEREDPHALYPTSAFRESGGSVVSSDDDRTIEALMTSKTFTSIRIAENVLSPENPMLRDLYRPHRRCVSLVDQNVEHHFGSDLDAYFAKSGIKHEKLVYRAMEVDKSIHTVERILGDFKALGVARNEPILIVGGGVLADVGGFACSLYHRNTPYVMLGSSIVSGIDAGPSPRTCCDGFGYKNLFGAYHAPILTITDRSFFRTLRPGWMRHGVAEIIKMAVVEDAALFEELEAAGPELLATRFGTAREARGQEIDRRATRILGGAMRSYVRAEYGNLYETHQCRPHAYGHTWSPGFEIDAGLLHGHAVAIGMGFGAFLSAENGWIDGMTLDRILGLISGFELSLWHDVLLDTDIMWQAQEKMVQKRGGNLAAPIPRGGIGRCGYLNEMSRIGLADAVERYAELVRQYPREGRGVEPLCSDVGLEDPSTVFTDTAGPRSATV